MKIKARHSHGAYIMLTLSNNRRMLEHRFIMQEKIGRKLKHEEQIHHKDHNGKNNKLSNLVLLSASDHAKLHGKEKKNVLKLICPQCGKTFERKGRIAKYRTKLNQRTFCSRQCSGKYSSALYWN